MGISMKSAEFFGIQKFHWLVRERVEKRGEGQSLCLLFLPLFSLSLSSLNNSSVSQPSPLSQLLESLHPISLHYPSPLLSFYLLSFLYLSFSLWYHSLLSPLSSKFSLLYIPSIITSLYAFRFSVSFLSVFSLPLYAGPGPWEHLCDGRLYRWGPPGHGPPGFFTVITL